MGLIRKTASISTLGLVKFRSKKERLRRAESAQQAAELDLAAEQAARTAADKRVSDAERRAKQAELAALHEAKLAQRRRRHRHEDRARGRRRARRKAGRKTRHAEVTMRESVSDLVSAAQPVVAAGAEKARRGGRAARRQAKRAAAQMAPRVEHAAAVAKDKASDLADRAKDVVDS
jgi:hypothetical protein